MISQRNFGHHPDGREIECYTLSLPNGAAVEILTLGGIVRSLHVPSRSGKCEDVTLGFSGLQGYLTRHPYFGAIVGRIAGRVPNGDIVVDGKAWSLPRNEPTNHLHGGHRGLDQRIWNAMAIDHGARGGELILNYFSPHGEEGYPGNVVFSVTYKLSAPCTFSITTQAITDQATPICLAHHSYFNLAGSETRDVLDHLVTIQADGIAAVDDQLSFTGQRIESGGQPGNLRTPSLLRDVLPRLPRSHGDMYFLHPADHPRPHTPVKVARLYAPATGIALDVHTDEACMQFYTGSALDGSCIGKNNLPYERYAGVCFECQGYPDGTRHPEWGEIMVRPGQDQWRHTDYVFSVSSQP